ncbi:response regulator transcription factor [Flavobacterium sp. SUN052]|uniref:response regulator n=1 Tax=Flavobacterium sp. SUN052 TaxID=3002441 RepID=UPI00237E5E52|nr:response regulator transcription factor [Flavobacterium sp. SUN052]MEC4004876.1 response regulator transcription factor [Flavobacterium sp. SUN052]
MELIRVGIVDDHLLFRRSLTLLIDSFKGMKVEVDAENGSVFLNKLENNSVDVVLLDIQMPVMDGYETCKHLLTQFPLVKILIVSQLSTRESIHKIMEIGAHGYFTKNSNPNQLELAIKSLHEQGFYFGLELGSVIKEAMLWESKNALNINNPIIDKLSERELQIIMMICKEMKSKEIADKLFINIRTVESHRKNILDKTNSKNFIGVILYALKRQMISFEDLE